ncbi:hypothetical protein MKX03_010812, partial [Papaver bracteatum]
KIRESGTRKCGCPFTLKGVWMAGDKWKVRVHYGAHNHEIPETLVGHSYEKHILVDLTKSGAQPRQVLSTLRQRSKENMSIRETYNTRATLKLMEIEGKSAMQQVLGLLLKHHYVEWHRRDKETDALKDIFWTHPESLQLALGSHSVLMVDCTYKTNRFGSLLKIVHFCLVTIYICNRWRDRVSECNKQRLSTSRVAALLIARLKECFRELQVNL